MNKDTLELTVERRALRPSYTIGRLYVDGQRFCDTLEDTDRGLRADMPLDFIKAVKVYGKTAIPTGRYRVRMDTISQKFAQKPWYAEFCGGRMPRIMDIPGYSGVLIHPGNTEDDTMGCLLVGENKEVGKVLYSRATFARLYAILKEAHEAGKEIWITYKYKENAI